MQNQAVIFKNTKTLTDKLGRRRLPRQEERCETFFLLGKNACGSCPDKCQFNQDPALKIVVRLF